MKKKISTTESVSTKPIGVWESGYSWEYRSLPENFWKNKLKLSLRWDFSTAMSENRLNKQVQVGRLWKRKKERKFQYQTKEAFFSYLNLKRSLRSSELQLRHNRLYLEALEAKYRAGLASVKDILEAQLLLHESEVQYETIKSHLYLAFIELLNATGRFGLDSLEN